jgi:Family of unknown function (DUF5670)
MLWTIAVILLVLWALGLVSSYTAGGFVHLLLVIAVIVIVFQFVSGRRSTWRRAAVRCAAGWRHPSRVRCTTRNVASFHFDAADNVIWITAAWSARGDPW